MKKQEHLSRSGGTKTPLCVILITGPKHSGKSLTARALGKILSGVVADIDDVIEKQTGKSPRELYKEGYEVFRKAETQAVVSLIQTPEPKSILTIAAGGGLIDNSEALALLRREDIISVCLDISAETAWRRILHTASGGELPPFLNTKNPKETHLALHTRRAEAYKALAHLTIRAENKTPEEIAGEIMVYLAARSE